MSEVIAQIPNELPYDAVGIWQIVPIGQTDFGLSGQPLADFVHRAVLALLESGGLPVRYVPGADFEWVHQKQYGTSKEEIAAAVVREWRSVPDDPLELIGECPWFARPDPAHPNYVKLD